jgi:DNA-binding transcriptional MerR regulator
MDTELTLEELAAEVRARISRFDIKHANGQVSPLPDARTLRFYTSVGLMDDPIGIRDRRAIYGERHVHQAVAVKRLQAEDLSLKQIRPILAGLPTKRLEAIAEGKIPAEAAPSIERRVDPPAAGGAGGAAGAGSRIRPRARLRAARQPEVLTAVPLGNGVTVLIPTRAPLEPADVEEIVFAGRPLVDHLLAARVIATGPGEKGQEDR